MRPVNERAALAILDASLGAASGWVPSSLVRRGIGDDAAVLTLGAGDHCWTVDSCEEGAHFRLSWLKPNEIAHKALHAAVSDVAAMGAEPVAMLCHVTLSPQTTPAFFRSFVRGQAAVAKNLGCPIVGGNLSHGERFGVVTTVLGRALRSRGRAGRLLPFLERATAQVGDEVWVVGELGWARLGYLWLEAERPSTRAAVKALRKFRRPEACLEEGRALAHCAHACMDVSDGLLRDVQTLAAASSRRVILQADRLRSMISPAFSKLAGELGVEPLSVLLSGGEDYALLATGPARKRPPFALPIGRVERGSGAYLEEGSSLRALTGGFQHQGG